MVKTGMNSEIGKIAEHLKGEEQGLTSVQKTMNAIGMLVTIAMLSRGQRVKRYIASALPCSSLATEPKLNHSMC